MASRAPGGSSFDSWLTGRLNSAGVDGEVFSSYISGTLGTLDGVTACEVEESLLEILQSCLEDEAECLSVCRDVQKQWLVEQESREAEKQVAKDEEVIPDQTKASPLKGSPKEDAGGLRSKVTLSSEEKMKLLEQYGCESDDEDPPEEASGGIKGAYVNQNTSVAGNAERLHRELLKANHDAKLDRDRRDREVQKQCVQERKEKEKKRTQKQERRR